MAGSLLRLRERWRSIVISMSVCVCLSVRQDISGTTRAIFTNFSVHVPYCRGSVLYGRVTKSQEEGAVLGVFFPTDNAYYTTYHLGPIQKRLNRSRCHLG